jgi:hypothetical protein
MHGHDDPSLEAGARGTQGSGVEADAERTRNAILALLRALAAGPSIAHVAVSAERAAEIAQRLGVEVARVRALASQLAGELAASRADDPHADK